MAINLDLFKERRLKLEAAAKQLKLEFVDLDTTIDQIISCITAWFVMPELIQRPVVVCLWGTTGVGKTAVTRRLCELLGVRDVMIETTGSDNRGEDTDGEDLERMIEWSDLNAGEPGVLLIDEMQYLRTIDSRGNDVSRPQIQPLWDLLSDGAIRKDSNVRSRIVGMIEEIRDEEEYASNRKDKSFIMGKRTTLYDARRLKMMCKLRETTEEIRGWDAERKLEKLALAIKSQSSYSGSDYSRLLIFIAGNLEDIFQGGDRVESPEIDADSVRRGNRENITLRKVREALSRRFKPEQIARMGNNHIVFPVPSKGTFSEIARRQLEGCSAKLREDGIVDIKWSPSVTEMICRNGAYAAQGVRPLVSNAAHLVSVAATNAVEHRGQEKAILISYDSDRKCLVGYGLRWSGETADKPLFTAPHEGSLDVEREMAKKDVGQRTSIAVHEAGHIVALACLWNAAPNQSVMCGTERGWVESPFLSAHACTRRGMFEEMIISAAGLEAEKAVLGDDEVTAGVCSDVERMTEKAVEIVRRWGTESGYQTRIGGQIDEHDTEIGSSNHEVRRIVSRARKEARAIIKKRAGVLASLAEMHLNSYVLTAEDIVACHAKHGIQLSIRTEKEDSRVESFMRWKAKNCRGQA